MEPRSALLNTNSNCIAGFAVPLLQAEVKAAYRLNANVYRRGQSRKDYGIGLGMSAEKSYVKILKVVLSHSRLLH
jgi:hypothetical protein